ncbi:MAP7 domain-containing protein [Methanosarcina sp. UBA289]|uniref:MAP7 domain-containing protein n=1 Tax=Methanosarcina sp. UBA289 TaxID=1915574 RepID=UPI0025F4C0DA|nr:MAP7 domain-containing protein [Methanosarcina sp. UBA289]
MADIEIKRGYEVLPDNKVRFGIRVINNGDSAISDVEVILDYSHSLFELESSKIEELGNIPPSIPRTAKFILKPLSCVHKEEIGATVRYRDYKWEKHIIDMRPKEVHCVYPFLKEKAITRSEFLRLSEESYSAEHGVNFENIAPEKLIDFLTHTCKNRLYKVDEFSIENGKVLYLSSESLGEKAYYLLTVVVRERENIVQVLLHASSDKLFGLQGFLNEILENLRHLVRSVSSAKEIGIIKNEQVITIIDSVVQHTDFSGKNDSSSVNIQDSIVQRTNFGSSQDENRKKEAEEKLHRQQEENERLRKEREEQERLRKQQEEEAKRLQEIKIKAQEEADRRKNEQERQQQEDLRRQREEEERKKREALEIKHREEQERKRRNEKEKAIRGWEEEQQRLIKHSVDPIDVDSVSYSITWLVLFIIRSIPPLFFITFFGVAGEIEAAIVMCVITIPWFMEKLLKIKMSEPLKAIYPWGMMFIILIIGDMLGF